MLNSIQKKLSQFLKIPKVNVPESPFSYYSPLLLFNLIASMAKLLHEKEVHLSFDVVPWCYALVFAVHLLDCTSSSLQNQMFLFLQYQHVYCSLYAYFWRYILSAILDVNYFSLFEIFLRKSSEHSKLTTLASRGLCLHLLSTNCA